WSLLFLVEGSHTAVHPAVGRGERAERTTTAGDLRVARRRCTAIGQALLVVLRCRARVEGSPLQRVGQPRGGVELVGLELDIRGAFDEDVGLRGDPDVAHPGVAVEVARLGDPDGRTLPAPRPLLPFPRPGLGVLDELLPEDLAVGDIAP